MSRNNLYLVLAVLAVIVVLFGIYSVYQEQQQPQLEVRLDDQGLSIDGNG
jgi:hypothetical protein